MDKLDGFFKLVVGDNREYRSEYFAFHDFHVGRNVREDCNGRVAVVDIAYASDDLCGSFGNGVLDERRMAFCCALVYNVDKVFTFVALCIGVSEHALDFVCKRFCEFLNFILRAKCVVWRNACLACVQRFAPSELLDVSLYACVREYNCWRFSAELKRNACVILGGHFCNVCADVWASGKENVVERKC